MTVFDPLFPHYQVKATKGWPKKNTRRLAMKTMKHFLFASLALVLLLSCVGPANAQGIAGKFTLPFTAYWGGATLPPGDYNFVIEHKNGMVYVNRGRSTVGMILPQSVDRAGAAANSLLITQTAGVRSVRELQLGGAGVVLRYSPLNLLNHKVTAASDKSFLIQIKAPGE
jgi:hypothetical protein